MCSVPGASIVLCLFTALGCASHEAHTQTALATDSAGPTTVQPMVAGDSLGLQIYVRQQQIAAAKADPSSPTFTSIPQD
jgi:hypothetical protein